MKQLFLFLMISVGALSQTVDSYVYDIYDNPMENVEIRNLHSEKVVFSDQTGFFSVEGDDRDTMLFTREGYENNRLTVRNIKNANGKIWLYNELNVFLPEVVIMPRNIINELFEKAVYNLKSRLIQHNALSYECTYIEKEINFGDERKLNILFTSILNKINPKQAKLNYEFRLAKLAFMPAQTSEMMTDINKLYNRNFFLSSLPNKIPKSANASMHISDSTIVIKIGGGIWTINKADTTLIKFEGKRNVDPQKYRWLRTFKGKDIYHSLSMEFRKDAEGYYLYERVTTNENSFLIGKPEKEERIISSLKISRLPYTVQDASLKIDLDTRKLFKMSNYPVSD